jgi:hypothetical protein
MCYFLGVGKKNLLAVLSAGSLVKKGRRTFHPSPIFCLIKDGTLFPLFCLTNPTQDNSSKIKANARNNVGSTVNWPSK